MGDSFDSLKSRTRAARGWLRRVMPRVAVAAAVVVVVRLLFDEFALPGAGAVRLLYRIASPVVYFVVAYYAVRGLLWLKRRLLWRVRRRLIITYLFVGLTPIILLFALFALVGLVGLNQVATRVVKVQLAAQEAQAQTSARMLAESLARIPADNRAAQAWLDERVSLLQAALPGARVAAWRDQDEADTGRPAQLVSEPADERTRGVGSDETPLGSPLPAWLAGRDEWHGLAFVAPPAEEAEAFGSPSIRALSRVRGERGRDVVLLVVVPISRAFVERLRADTGLTVRPFFIGAEGAEVRINRTRLGTSYATIGNVGAQRHDPENPDGAYIVEGSRVVRLDFRRDQFGDPVGPKPPVILSATNWKDGTESLRAAFISDFNARLVASQLFGEGGFGQVLQGTITFIAVVFLVLELLALLSAAWMTRAVTVAVHRLHHATDYIKRGDFSHRVRLRSHDQLGELAAAFNEMSADIEQLLTERVEREKLEREIEIAADVQAQLFPRAVPKLSGVEIAGECRAARGVAGDYYDYVEVAPGLVCVALGDVSGKGLSAALVMSNLQASLRAQATILSERTKLARQQVALTTAATTAAGGGDEPEYEMPCGVTGTDAACAVSQMAASINDQLCRSTDSNRFVTAFVALYDDAARTLRYTNAGHNPPLLVRASGAVERLEAGGTVLGAFEWAAYEEGNSSLSRGDLLLLYSDGITEAQDGAGEEYGDERLAAFARANRALAAGELCAAIFREIDTWAGGRERDDDQTVVILKAG
ncbi:MAG TPA: SpoIIE family protein phosphatase [Pyrinomonadaceae bacterium]|nr:SpoIIE family protein phosphatase [Pyrinomonadaceae bacterium]